MATITLTIPDSIVADFRDAICERYGYNPETDGTKAAFAKLQIIKWCRREYAEHKANTAAAVASATASSTANADLNIT
jgi:hypothetical protein